MQIFKLLPRTNCKDCGSPSCLTFAMKIAAGKADYKQCPHISEESLAKLGEMMESPIRKITLKRGDKEIVLGDEKVLFRHDETFYNPTALAINIPAGLDDETLKSRIEEIESFNINRAGQDLHPDMIAAEEGTSNPSETVAYFKKITDLSGFPLLFRFKRAETLKAFINDSGSPGIICYAGFKPDKVEPEILNKISAANIPLALPCRNLEEAEKAGEFLQRNNIRNGIFAVESDTSGEKLDLLTSLRKKAIIDGNRKAGYPALVWGKSDSTDTGDISTAIMKYGSIAVTDSVEPSRVLPFLTLRQNIFTDPRRPIQVEAKVYEFGSVNGNSPVLITTNFSLTYFTVAQEIEASRIPCYLVIVDTEGTSVLTAWSSDRFNAKRVIEAVEKEGIPGMVSHRQLIIPGYVAPLKEEIEEISSWKIITGPREAVDIPRFLRSMVRSREQ